MVFPPAFNRLVVTRKQYLGNFQAAVLTRPSVLRVFQPTIPLGKGIVHAAFFVTEYAGRQPHYGVNHDHRADFAAVEDVIADRNFIGLKEIDHPLIETFITPAEEDQPLVLRQFFDHPLR